MVGGIFYAFVVGSVGSPHSHCQRMHERASRAYGQETRQWDKDWEGKREKAKVGGREGRFEWWSGGAHDRLLRVCAASLALEKDPITNLMNDRLQEVESMLSTLHVPLALQVSSHGFRDACTVGPHGAALRQSCDFRRTRSAVTTRPSGTVANGVCGRGGGHTACIHSLPPTQDRTAGASIVFVWIGGFGRFVRSIAQTIDVADDLSTSLAHRLQTFMNSYSARPPIPSSPSLIRLPS